MSITKTTVENEPFEYTFKYGGTTSYGEQIFSFECGVSGSSDNLSFGRVRWDEDKDLLPFSSSLISVEKDIRNRVGEVHRNYLAKLNL